MTKKEIAILLNYSNTFIHKMFRIAALDDTFTGRNIKAKNNTSTVSKVIDYTLDECLYALKYLPVFTPMQKQYLMDNFVHRKEQYEIKSKKGIKLSRSARQFLFLYKQNPVKVCATCKYLCAKKHNKVGAKFRPFCSFSNCFVAKAKPKRDIYKDRCLIYSPADKPMIFNKDGISNVDYLGNIEYKTLGINNTEFTTGLTKGGKELVILNTVEN